MKRKKGFYSISVVAEMFEVHQQTIRMYEKEGLIAPKRSDGNTRLFSEEDVDRLEEIIYLTHKMGVNLAGVEIILKLKKRVGKLQDELNGVIQSAQSQLDQDVEDYKQGVQKQARRLLEIKKENMQQVEKNNEKKHIDIKDVVVDDPADKFVNKKNNHKADSIKDIVEIGDKRDLDDWKIEYED
jgi:MerR family transcriptional regulator, heat shock protein HspR